MSAENKLDGIVGCLSEIVDRVSGEFKKMDSDPEYKEQWMENFKQDKLESERKFRKQQERRDIQDAYYAKYRTRILKRLKQKI